MRPHFLIAILLLSCKRPEPRGEPIGLPAQVAASTTAKPTASAPAPLPAEAPAYKEHGASCVPVITQDNDCAVSVPPGTTDEQVAALGRLLVAKRPKGSWRIFDDATHIDAVTSYLQAPAKGKLTKEQDAWMDSHYLAWAYRGFSPTQKRDVGKVEFRRDNPATGKRTPLVEF